MADETTPTERLANAAQDVADAQAQVRLAMAGIAIDERWADDRARQTAALAALSGVLQMLGQAYDTVCAPSLEVPRL